jgi:3-oxoadipate enol-lactonase
VSALSYDLIGLDGAPVVALGPSLGAPRRMWSAAAAALSQRFRVISFDLLGHGTSAMPDGPYSIGQIGRAVLDLLDDVGAASVSYVGVSLGGMVGMWLAINAPDRVDRLALVCTAAHLPPADGWLERAATVRARGTASIADAVVTRWFTEPFRIASPRVVAEFRAMIAASPDEGYAACCEAIAGMDQRAGLTKIVAPTLVIAGADDPATPPSHGETIAARVPGSRFVVLDNAAHLANVERADVVTALISEFLED